MHSNTLLRILGLFACLALTNCAALFPFKQDQSNADNGRNGQSLDNPPTGQSRYMGEPLTDTPEAPNPDAPVTDPNAIAQDKPLPSPADIAPAPNQPVMPKPAVPLQAAYGKMVPGRVGFVYPPGVEAKPENMVDVRGFSPGEKVRDPRTGKVFLVP